MRLALLTGLLLALLPTNTQASEVALPEGNWRQIDVSGLTLITDMKPDKAIELGQKLTRLEDWLEIFAVVDASYHRPRTLYLFHDHEALEPFLPLYKGKPANMAGFTVADFDEIVMALDATSYEDPLSVVYHEFVHAFLSERVPLCPLWVQEGIAELHSNFEVDGDYVIVGKRIDRHRDVFKNQGFLSAARFLSLDPSDPEYNEGLRQSSYYAQSWATIHYLLTAKERRDRFKDYLQRIHDGQPEPIALYTAFGKDFPNPERDLKPYVLQHDFPFFKLKRPAKSKPGDAVVQEIEPMDLHVALGNLLLRARPADDPAAMDHFQAALEMNPDQPHALRGLALAMWRNSNETEAIETLERAVALPDIDVPASTMLGSLLMDQYLSDSPEEIIREGDEVPEVLQHAREQFERALSVEDSNPFALYGLGTTLVLSGEYDEAQGYLERSTELSPWRSEPQRALVSLYLRKGDVERAREVYENGLKPLTRPRERYDLQVSLVQAEIYEARRLAARGEHTKAAMLLTKARGLAEGRSVIHNLDNALANVSTSEAVSRYNEAISELRVGHYDKAISILEDLQSEDLDDALREGIDRMLESLRQAKHSS